MLTAAAAAACALISWPADANTVDLGAVTVTIGGGGTFADYLFPIETENTTVNTTDPSFININDFGLGTVQSNTLPGTWSFSQPLVGPNSGNLGVDNPAVADAVFMLIGGAGAVPDGIYSIVIRTTLTGIGGVAQWTTSDRETAGGLAAGLPSAAQGFVRSPVAVSVPDGVQPARCSVSL
jgi:hypothetical protein